MTRPHVSAAWLLVVAFVSAAILAHAQGTPSVTNPRIVTAQGPESFSMRVVASDLAGPWEITWGPDGILWITERVASA